jgi:DNA polymerase-3 subunit beta
MGFEGDGRRTTTRLLDGEFPKYRALLPSESASVASVDTASLVEAVKRVALVAERNTPVRLTFSGGQVELRAGAGDEAQATESLECEIDGDAIEIAFNPQYLLDGLGALDDATTQLSFTTATRPAVLTGAGAESPSTYRYLLMPVRLSG